MQEKRADLPPDENNDAPPRRRRCPHRPAVKCSDYRNISANSYHAQRADVPQSAPTGLRKIYPAKLLFLADISRKHQKEKHPDWGASRSGETTGLDFIMVQPPSSRRLATLRRSVAFRSVRVPAFAKKKSTPIGVLQTVEKVQLLLGFFHFL